MLYNLSTFPLIFPLELVGLSGLNNRSSNALSGGQKQRLSIARAILKNSPIILLDEVFTHLDLEKKSSLLENLNEVIAEVNKAKPASAKGDYIKSVFISSTMGPSIPLEINS